MLQEGGCGRRWEAQEGMGVGRGVRMLQGNGLRGTWGRGGGELEGRRGGVVLGAVVVMGWAWRLAMGLLMGRGGEGDGTWRRAPMRLRWG